MLGVVNKAIRRLFVSGMGTNFGLVLIDLSLPGYQFEAMLTYEDGITYDLIDRFSETTIQNKMCLRILVAIWLLKMPSLHPPPVTVQWGNV